MLLPPPRPSTASGRNCLAAVECLHRHVCLGQRGTDAVSDAGLDKDAVGDEQHAAGTEAAGDFAELAGGVAAEQQLAGGMEGPGGAHGAAPGGGLTGIVAGRGAAVNEPLAA